MMNTESTRFETEESGVDEVSENARKSAQKLLDSMEPGEENSDK